MAGPIRYINFSGYYDKFDDSLKNPSESQYTRVS